MKIQKQAQTAEPQGTPSAATFKLDRKEWDFSNVTDNAERVACCWWEYARESVFIRETVRCYYEGGGCEEIVRGKRTRVKIPSRLYDHAPVTELTPTRELNVLLFDTRAKSDPQLFPQPWQALPSRLRQTLAAAVNQFYRAMDQLERLQRRRNGENIPAPLTMEIGAR